jgi:hypothetical protein
MGMRNKPLNYGFIIITHKKTEQGFKPVPFYDSVVVIAVLGLARNKRRL